MKRGSASGTTTVFQFFPGVLPACPPMPPPPPPSCSIWVVATRTRPPSSFNLTDNGAAFPNGNDNDKFASIFNQVLLIARPSMWDSPWVFMHHSCSLKR